MTSASPDLTAALRALLMEGGVQTQEDICQVMQKRGFEINQTKVSRLLRSIGAVKVQNAQGETTYSLPREPVPLAMDAPLRHLVLDVVANETVIVIHTSPGSASMVARLLDHLPSSAGVLGTLAGDDTIFVAPRSVHEIVSIKENIHKLLLS